MAAASTSSSVAPASNPAGAIIDLDGTVYLGPDPIPGAASGVRALREAGVDVLFVSNKAIGRPAAYREKLRSFGVPCGDGDVVTSASVTAEYLRRHHPDRRAFVVGEEPLRAELRDATVSVTSDPATAEVVVASLDRSLDYETLEDLLAALDGETPYVATNPDRTCPVADGVIPDAGATIGAIEGLTGRRPDVLMGKPSETITTVAARRLGHDPEHCLLVGDRLDTDVAMGARAGMHTALVLSGVTAREDLAGGDVRPDHVIESLADVGTVLDDW